MVSNILFGSYQLEWTDYLKTYSSIVGWNFQKVTFTFHPEFPTFSDKVVSILYHGGKTCVKFFGTKRIVCNWVVYITNVGIVLSLVSLGLRELSRMERCPFCRDVQNEKFNICSRKIIWMNTVSGQLFFFIPSSSQFPRQLFMYTVITHL